MPVFSFYLPSRSNAARRRRLLICQNLGGHVLPLPPPPFGTCLIPMYVVWCPTWSKESEVSLLMPVKFRDLISNYSAKIFEYWMLSKQNILSCSLFSFRITLILWPRNLTKTNFVDDRFLCFLRKIGRTQKIVKRRLQNLQ